MSQYLSVSDNHLDLTHDCFDEIRKTDVLKNKENWLKKRDGTIFPALFSVGAVSRYNCSTEYLSIISDISEIYDMRKNLEEARNTIQKQLEKIKNADNLKDEFSAMITHEMNTSLMQIIGYCKMLKKQMMGAMTKDQLDAIDEIRASVQRLESLIYYILDAKKIEMSKLNLDLRSESIKEIVKRCIDIFRPITDRRQIDIVNSTQNIVVKCDSDRMLQVLNNVMSNAIKFVPEKQDTISINSRIENDSVIVSIADWIGIPKIKQENLFKGFYQVDKSLTRKSGGTGLGLAISHGIIESHGGKIWVASEEGQSTTVSFSISGANSN